MFLFFLYMGFRTVVLDKANKINLDLNNLVVLYNDEKFYINIDEIDTIIIEDPRCYVSLRLLSELCKNGINIILTDTSHVPIGTVQTLFNHSRASKNILKQINWSIENKNLLWKNIIYNKISNQILVLMSYKRNEKLSILSSYLNSIEDGDLTNREGLASRTYFKELFGDNFKRFDEDIVNFSLNYSYQIIRSKISQEIVALGYNPSLGICHKSEYNSYNLADDVIEVFRPCVDKIVYEILLNSEEQYLTPDLKNKFANILNENIYFNNQVHKIRNCIVLYLQSIFSFMENPSEEFLKFPVIYT